MSDAHGVARDQLRAFIERIERLEEEKKTIAEDIKDVYGEAKSMGFDTKIMKQVIALRKKDDQERTEEDLIRDTYLAALGMIPDFEPEGEEEAPRQKRQPPMVKSSPRGDTVSEINPRLVQQVVTGMQTEAGRAALIAAVDIMIEREEAEGFQAKASGDNGATGQADEEAADSMTGDASRTSRGVDTPATNSPSDDDAIAAVNPERGLANVADVEPSSSAPIAPASQGEAEALTGSTSGPTEGGSHVDSSAPRAGQADQTSNIGEGERELIKALPGTIKNEVDPPTPMKRASFAHCFPELTSAAYNRLLESISDFGLSEPIVRKGDVILDGFCRFNIARSLGISYPVIEYDGSDELLDVIRWQRSSRDWTPQQEAKIAKALAAEVPARAEEIWAALHLAPTLEGEVAA